MAPLESKPYAEFDNQSRFETLLAEISTLFISLPVDQVDSKIEDVQRCICEFLNIDRSTLWQVLDQDQGTLLLTHIYQPAEAQSPPDRMDAQDFFPWLLQKMMAGETVTGSYNFS